MKWVFVILGLLILLGLVLWLAGSGKRREKAEQRNREEAAALRQQAQGRQQQVAQQQADAASANAEAERARAQAEQQAQEARRRQETAAAAEQQAQAARQAQERQLREADRLDPDVRTDDAGNRLDDATSDSRDGRTFETSDERFGRREYRDRGADYQTYRDEAGLAADSRQQRAAGGALGAVGSEAGRSQCADQYPAGRDGLSDSRRTGDSFQGDDGRYGGGSADADRYQDRGFTPDADRPQTFGADRGGDGWSERREFGGRTTGEREPYRNTEDRFASDQNAGFGQHRRASDEPPTAPMQNVGPRHGAPDGRRSSFGDHRTSAAESGGFDQGVTDHGQTRGFDQSNPSGRPETADRIGNDRFGQDESFTPSSTDGRHLDQNRSADAQDYRDHTGYRPQTQRLGQRHQDDMTGGQSRQEPTSAYPQSGYSDTDRPDPAGYGDAGYRAPTSATGQADSSQSDYRSNDDARRVSPDDRNTTGSAAGPDYSQAVRRDDNVHFQGDPGYRAGTDRSLGGYPQDDTGQYRGGTGRPGEVSGYAQSYQQTGGQYDQERLRGSARQDDFTAYPQAGESVGDGRYLDEHRRQDDRQFGGGLPRSDHGYEGTGDQFPHEGQHLAQSRDQYGQQGRYQADRGQYQDDQSRYADQGQYPTDQNRYGDSGQGQYPDDARWSQDGHVGDARYEDRQERDGRTLADRLMRRRDDDGRR